MSAALTQGLWFPLVILLVEYFAIQPWLRYRESKSLMSKDIDNHTTGRKWGDGIRNGIKQFKQHTNYYNWGGISVKQHFVELVGFNISKGQAEIFLIVKVRYLLDKRRPVGGYRIVIDRLGDISEFETLETRKNPFDSQELPFPGSWLAVGLLLLIVLACRFFASLPSGFVVDTNGGTPAPVSEWSNLAIPVVLDTPINGTVGDNEREIYKFNTSIAGRVNINVNPIESFRCILSVYDENGSRIRSKFIDRSNSSIEIAPEPNRSYLIVVTPATSGGSYILNISLSQE
jgi:hypothetical protein